MDISVVVPLYNEAESLPELEAWIRRVMEENKFSYEISKLSHKIHTSIIITSIIYLNFNKTSFIWSFYSF